MFDRLESGFTDSLPGVRVIAVDVAAVVGLLVFKDVDADVAAVVVLLVFNAVDADVAAIVTL